MRYTCANVTTKLEQAVIIMMGSWVRYPTSKEAFDKLPYVEQWEIKVNLLTDNIEFLEESLNTDCVRDLVAKRTLHSNNADKVYARERFDGQLYGIRELLTMLPRCGDYWWRSLEYSLLKSRRYEQYYRLNPWEQERQHGESGEPPTPPSPSLQVSMLTNDTGRELQSSLHSDPVPLPSAPLSTSASPLPSSGPGEVNVTAAPMVSNVTNVVNVNGSLRQLNFGKTNKLIKHTSRSGISIPTGNAQRDWEETEEGGDPEGQDPHDDRDFTASAEQPRSYFAQETAEEAFQNQDHSQSYQGLYGTDSVVRVGSESSYYSPWNHDAQETALKEVCRASLSACRTHADSDAALQQTEISATQKRSLFARWSAIKEWLHHGLSYLEYI